MTKTRSARELQDLLRSVSDFVVAAEALREDRTNTALSNDVAFAAGRASIAAEVANVLATHRSPPAAGGRAVRYNPIAAWNSEISPFQDQLVLAIEAAHQIRGALQAALDRAKAEERSIVGRVSRIVGFPARVGRHLADRGYSSGVQRAGFVTSMMGQLVIAVVASIVAAVVIGVLR